MPTKTSHTWRPPGSLIGPHWEIQLLHIGGQWITYTEHTTEFAARSLAERLTGSALFRIVEVSS